MLKNRYQEIFDRAHELGIKKWELGLKIWGPNSRWIYKLGAPTRYEKINYARLEEALKQLEEERKLNEKKN